MASSVNLLVLKFMTISLEEVTIGKTEKSETCFTVNRGYHQEQHGEDELNDVGTNVVTLDEEVISRYPLSIALHAVLSLFV